MNPLLTQAQWTHAFEQAKLRAVSVLKIQKLADKKRAMIGRDVAQKKLTPTQALAQFFQIEKIETVAEAHSTPVEKIDLLTDLLK